MYPFTIYHSSSKSQRRYTLYANNEASRKKWQEELINAIGVHKVRSESNMVLIALMFATPAVPAKWKRFS